LFGEDAIWASDGIFMSIKISRYHISIQDASLRNAEYRSCS